MDSGFMTQLVAAIKAANKPVTIAEPQGRYLLLGENGNYQNEESVPPRRNHLFHRPETLCQFAGRSPDSTIWIDETKLVITPDDHASETELIDLRDRGELPVGWSSQFSLLNKWSTRTQISPRQLIWDLRTTFAGFSITPQDFLSLVRNVKFSKKEEGNQSIQHGKASIGRSLEAELKSGEKAFPENFTVSVPVLNPPFGDYRQAITVVLDVDPTSEQFFVQTIDSELATANLWALEKVKEELEGILSKGSDTTTKLYYGLPEIPRS